VRGARLALVAIACLAVAATGLAGDLALPRAAAGDLGRRIVDMANRAVNLPQPIRRVACFEVLCYEKFFLLGGGPLVAAMYRTDPPWMTMINPSIGAIRKVENTPNREELLADRIDVVFLREDRQQLRALAQAGIPAVVSQPPAGTRFKDAAAFAAAQKRMVRLVGSIIGGDAETTAEEWSAWYDERIAYVMGRTADIPEPRRLRAYYLRGPAAAITQGRDSSTYWYGTIAGATMIVKNLELASPGLMSMEEIVSLDPEYIFVGRQYSPDLVLHDPKWRNVSAVKKRPRRPVTCRHVLLGRQH
jgi:iron complex transport system substrate-binding protein